VARTPTCLPLDAALARLLKASLHLYRTATFANRLDATKVLTLSNFTLKNSRNGSAPNRLVRVCHSHVTAVFHIINVWFTDHCDKCIPAFGRPTERSCSDYGAFILTVRSSRAHHHLIHVNYLRRSFPRFRIVFPLPKRISSGGPFRRSPREPGRVSKR